MCCEENRLLILGPKQQTLFQAGFSSCTIHIELLDEHRSHLMIGVLQGSEELGRWEIGIRDWSSALCREAISLELGRDVRS